MICVQLELDTLVRCLLHAVVVQIYSPGLDFAISLVFSFRSANSVP